MGLTENPVTMEFRVCLVFRDKKAREVTLAFRDTVELPDFQVSIETNERDKN